MTYLIRFTYALASALFVVIITAGAAFAPPYPTFDEESGSNFNRSAHLDTSQVETQEERHDRCDLYWDQQAEDFYCTETW